MQIDAGVAISSSAFRNWAINFANMRVGRMFTIDDSGFNSGDISFADLRVDGRFSVQRCAFSFDSSAFGGEATPFPNGRPGSKVSFNGAHLGDFFLNDSSFDHISIIDLTRLQADLIS